MKKLAIIACAAVLAFSANAAMAEQPVTLKGDVLLEKTVTENGITKRVLVEPKKVVPGDRLLFTTAYRNGGAKTVSKFVVTNPIPAGVVYAADASAAAEVSVDGGKSWGLLERLKVSGPNGTARAAQASDVTHVRWIVPTITAGASGTVTYHAVVR